MVFKDGDGLIVSDVSGERVPVARGKVAEGSRPHGGPTERWDGEVDSRGRPERPKGNADVEEVGQIWKGEFMDGCECTEDNLVVHVSNS